MVVWRLGSNAWNLPLAPTHTPILYRQDEISMLAQSSEGRPMSRPFAIRRNSFPVTLSNVSLRDADQVGAVSTRSCTSFAHACSNGISIGMASRRIHDEHFVD